LTIKRQESVLITLLSRSSPPGGRKGIGMGGSVEDYSSARLELWKSAMGQYQFVTAMFWQQANFFIAIHAALLTVVASQFLLKGKEKLWPLLFVSLLGLGLALFWAVIACNRVRIIEEWDRQVQILDLHRVYVSVQAKLKEMKVRKPTQMTQRLVPLALIAVWIVLIFWAIGAAIYYYAVH
jgi:hypothetical protein